MSANPIIAVPGNVSGSISSAAMGLNTSKGGPAVLSDSSSSHQFTTGLVSGSSPNSQSPSRRVYDHPHLMSLIYSHLDRPALVDCACVSQASLEVAVTFLWKDVTEGVVSKLLAKKVDLNRFKLYLEAVRNISLKAETADATEFIPEDFTRLYPNLSRIDFEKVYELNGEDNVVDFGLTKDGGAWTGSWMKFRKAPPLGLSLFKQDDFDFNPVRGKGMVLLGLSCNATQDAEGPGTGQWDPWSLLDIEIPAEDLSRLLGSMRFLRLDSGPVKWEWLAKVLPHLTEIQSLEVTIDVPPRGEGEPSFLSSFHHILSKHNHHLLDLKLRLRHDADVTAIVDITHIPAIDNLSGAGRLLYLEVGCDLMNHDYDDDEEGRAEFASLLRILADGQESDRIAPLYRCEEMNIYVGDDSSAEVLPCALLLIKYVEPTCRIRFFPLQPQSAKAELITAWGWSVIQAREMLLAADRMRRAGKPGYVWHGKMGVGEAGSGELAVGDVFEVGGKQGGQGS